MELNEAESEALHEALDWVDRRMACPHCGPIMRDEARENRERWALAYRAHFVDDEYEGFVRVSADVARRHGLI